MAARSRLSLHVWIASPSYFVLGLLGLHHGAILRGLCVFPCGLSGLMVIFGRNASDVGFPEKLARACYGLGLLLLIAIGIDVLPASQP